MDCQYEDINPDDLINPEDLLKPFSELVEKAKALEATKAPKMLKSAMLSLALEIETNRRQALAVMNPLNPEPIELMIPDFDRKQLRHKNSIIKILARAGWMIHRSNSGSIIKLTAKQFDRSDVKTG